MQVTSQHYIVQYKRISKDYIKQFIFYRALRLRSESTSRAVPSCGQALGLHGLLKVVRWSSPLTTFHILWNMTSSFAMSFR